MTSMVDARHLRTYVPLGANRQVRTPIGALVHRTRVA